MVTQKQKETELQQRFFCFFSIELQQFPERAEVQRDSFMSLGVIDLSFSFVSMARCRVIMHGKLWVISSGCDVMGVSAW